MSKIKKVKAPAEKEFGKELGFYWLGPTFSAQKEIQNITDEYKLSVLKKFYSLTPSYINPINKEKKYKNLPDDLIVSIKRDGSYYCYYYDTQSDPLSVFCNSPNARVLYNLPVNREIEKKINHINKNTINSLKDPLEELIGNDVFSEHDFINKIVIAGELFANIDKEGDRPRVFDLIGIIFNPEKMEDLEKIHYDIFDIISINDHDLLTLPYRKRLQICKLLFSRDEKYKANTIEHHTGVKAGTVYKLFERWVEKENHEGIVIHTKFNMVYKVKNVFSIDAVIIGYVELLKEKLLPDDEGGVSTLLLALMHEDGTYQELCHMGGGFTYEQRIELFNLLKNDIVQSSFRASKGDGRAFRFVEPRYIIQINYMDFITEDGKGKPIMKMSLNFENNQWTPIRSIPFVSLISPRYDVMRSDLDKEKYPSLEFENPKEVRYEDIRCDQILNLVPIDLQSSQERLKGLPQSEIIFKAVFEGEWGGYEFAEKIMLWKTNKRELNPSYPNYVVYYGNYNYIRKQPLTQKIYPFNTLEKAIDHLNWIFIRPDNRSKGFLNKKRSDFKRSIKTPPYMFLIKEDYKTHILDGFDLILRKLLFKEKLEIDIDWESVENELDESDFTIESGKENNKGQKEKKEDKDLLDKLLEQNLDDIDFDDL